jgi:ubiquinone/menaquinone biosynthesis C-methylase UbiE
LNLHDQRRAEHAKYDRAYALNPNYRMKRERMADAARDLAALPIRGTYLDVACGRGEMLCEATRIGFDVVMGTEIVPDLVDGKRVVYGEAHALPFLAKQWNVVTLFDVIEHLVAGDDELACRELARVARDHILITANNRPSFNKAGDDLHINKRPYDEWDRLFRQWFAGAAVTWIKGQRAYVSECWRIDL